MSRVYKIIFFPLFLMLINGCSSDMLNLYPYDEMSSGNVWNKASLAELAVTGVYNNLLYDYNAASQARLNWDAFSSIMDPSSSIYNNYSLLLGTITSNESSFETYWKVFYEGIPRANDVIGNIHKVPDMKDEKKAQYIAECKFLRAYYYYRLNVLWRGVPLYMEPTEVADYSKARSSESDVWKAIVEDLTDCVEEPNLPDKYSSGSTSFGRATKAAAYTLRGKVYLWQKNWNAAQSDFEEVTKMGYGLFQSGYANLFKVENEKCDEIIFSIQMEEESGYGSARPYRYGNPLTAGNGYSFFFFNTRFADSYECIDGKPFNWDDYILGYSSMEPKARSVFFLRDGLKAKEKAEMSTYGADMTQYLSAGNEARIQSAYQNRDPRMSATMILPYSTYEGGLTGATYTYTYRWPYRGYDAKDPFDFRSNLNNYMLYSIRKFVPVGREHIFTQYNPVDIPIFRYADVLLCLAEALNEQDETGEAVKYVNMVRNRAGIAPLNSNAYTQVADKAEMRRRIRHERSVELAGEEQIYFDELRWEIWKDKKFASGNGLLEVWGAPVYEYFWVGDQCLLWALPASECEKNTNLKQNPDW